MHAGAGARRGRPTGTQHREADQDLPVLVCPLPSVRPPIRSLVVSREGPSALTWGGFGAFAGDLKKGRRARSAVPPQGRHPRRRYGTWRRTGVASWEGPRRRRGARGNKGEVDAAHAGVVPPYLRLGPGRLLMPRASESSSDSWRPHHPSRRTARSSCTPAPMRRCSAAIRTATSATGRASSGAVPGGTQDLYDVPVARSGWPRPGPRDARVAHARAQAPDRGPPDRQAGTRCRSTPRTRPQDGALGRRRTRTGHTDAPGRHRPRRAVVADGVPAVRTDGRARPSPAVRAGKDRR